MGGGRINQFSPRNRRTTARQKGKNMKFSIIIPAHNSSGFIRHALDSIKSQVYTDYELIVICDSCDDNTEEIAREYGAITESVDYHCDGTTRNHGLRMAKGDWILFMDDDDWWLHEYVLTELARVLHDGIDILCFSFIFKGVGYERPTDNRGSHWIAPWCKCYKRSAIGDSRFSSATDGTADILFYTQMFNKGLRVVDWDVLLYYYNYMRQGSQTERNSRWIS